MDHTIPHLSRRGFVAGAAAQAVKGQPQASRKAPNILYIMTDQQHAGMLSCEGNRWVKTPAMDSIAAKGVRFELAYSSNPVCMPARTSMMTGHYPSRFDMRGNTQANVPGEAIENGLGNLFRKAGYRTWFGGKTHWPKPMTPEEAVVQIEGGKEQFVVFRDAETNRTGVLYRRSDGNFGLIEP